MPARHRVGCLAVLVALLAACGGEDNPAGPGTGAPGDCPDPAQGAQTQRDIVVPGDRFDFDEIPSNTDPRAHPLFATIWNTLMVQPGVECWQAQGGTNNLQFFENPAFGPGPRYRFVGTLDTEAGPLIVYAVGCYTNPSGQSFHAAAITTYAGTVELLAVVSGNAIDHFIGHQGDFPLVTRYVATADLCL